MDTYIGCYPEYGNEYPHVGHSVSIVQECARVPLVCTFKKWNCQITGYMTYYQVAIQNGCMSEIPGTRKWGKGVCVSATSVVLKCCNLLIFANLIDVY